MKKITIFVILILLGMNLTVFASTNEPLKNLGEGLDNMVYSVVEVPDSVAGQGEGTPVSDKCTAKTNDDVGRGIARFVGGLWQVATFWYPKD